MFSITDLLLTKFSSIVGADTAVTNSKSYEEVREQLKIYNASIALNNGLVLNNPADKNFISYTRNKIDKSSGGNYYRKEEFLGIVLYVAPAITIETGRVIRRIYVDVPLFDFEKIIHPDTFDPIKFGIDLNDSKFDHLIFYPESEGLFTREPPTPKSIVRVKIPPNYPNNSRTNPLDNKYLGTFSGIQIAPIQPTAQGEISPINPETLKFVETALIKKIFSSFRPTGITSVKPENQLSLPFSQQHPINSFVDTARQLKGAVKPAPHNGIDFGMPTGTPIVAPVDMDIIPTQEGTKQIWVPVRNGGSYNAPGITIKAKSKDGEFFYEFHHLSQKLVTSGSVLRGTPIALSGDTGYSTAPHLHFEVRDKNRQVINPLYLFTPNSIELSDGAKKFYGFDNQEVGSTYLLRQGAKVFIRVPIPLGVDPQVVSTGTDVSTAAPADVARAAPVVTPPSKEYTAGNTEEFIANVLEEGDGPFEAPAVPTTPVENPDDDDEKPAVEGTTKSKPVNRPKLLLQNFTTDRANGIRDNFKVGSNSIKIREDIYSDLLNIKQKLNRQGISLTCLFQEISLENKNISLLTKVGLGFSLNKFAGLTPSMNLQTDDFFIGPNYSKPLGMGYKLNIYAAARKSTEFIGGVEIPQNLVVDVYDIRATYLRGPPKIIKLNKFFINLTDLFESFGFRQIEPNPRFFMNSDYELSNWFLIEKPNKLKKGYSYKELLETVYKPNSNVIWKEPDLIWDGRKFIDA